MPQEIFFAAGSRLRPFWRFAISAVGVVLTFLSLSLLPRVAFEVAGHPLQPLLDFAWLTVVLLAIFKLLTRLLEGQPLKSIGLALYSRWFLDLGIGLGLGAAMILAVAATERLLGLAVFSRSSQPAGEVGLSGLFFFALLALAAVNEELAFRGYPFQRLVESIGPVAAVTVISALFGLVHLWNPGHTWISTVNTALVGVPLSVAYLRTRALWMSIGLHFAWNFFLGYGLGLPVSGFDLSGSVLRAKVHGAAWLTGADYGPEASVLATAAILAATLYLLFSKRIYTSREMRALVLGAGRMALLVGLTLGASAVALAREALTRDARITLIRGLAREIAVTKITLPRGKHGVFLNEQGRVDQARADDEVRANGPAVRPGMPVEITRIAFRADRIVFEINGGGHKGKKWYQRIEIGVGGATQPIVPENQVLVYGSWITLKLPDKNEDLSVAQVKQLLANALDFERHSPTVLYTPSVPPKIKEAIKNHKVVVGMDHDAVLSAKGPPERKVREMRDGVEQEDWIYGLPPHVLFVTFDGDTVVAVRQY